MALEIDTQQFDIVITALGEGFGQLVSVTITTPAASYTLDIGTQTWAPSPPAAYPGDSITLSATIQNTGPLQDNIFGTFSSGQITPAEPSTQLQTTVAGGTFSPVWSFIMAALDVNISLNAGHETTG